MVDVLREAVLLEQLVGWVLELGQGLRRAAHVAQGGGALGGAGVGAEGGRGARWTELAAANRDAAQRYKRPVAATRRRNCGCHLTEAVRERCSRESITQPTWHSMGGLELCRVLRFLGV